MTELVFDPLNPYPLLEADTYSYSAAKAHAEKVDQWLGFATENIERTLRTDQVLSAHQTWSELSVQSFQTPYCELRSLLRELSPLPGQTIVDLGSAYNRLAFIMARHYPSCSYIGIEISLSRVTHSQERLSHWPQTRQTLLQGNLLEMQIPTADFYFIYDFGHNDGIRHVLQELQKISLQRPIQVVARGRATRHFIMTENPWLSQIAEPRHFEHFSIFKSA